MRKSFNFLSDLYRKWRAHSVHGRIETLENRIAKHLGDVNFSLGVLNEHVLEEIRLNRHSDGETSTIVASMDNMNKNITELFECLIEFNRIQKTLIARLEKHGLKDL